MWEGGWPAPATHDDMDERNVSHFEMLDEPEGPRSHGRAWSERLDLLLGLVVLLAVAGLAGWQWWSEQQRAASYDAGLRYAQGRRWDAASSAYRDAGGYRDAEQRLAEVERTIAQRDTTYANALAEAGRGEWATALRDLREVDKIEPRFRDSGQMSTTVEQEVYAQALSGTVAMRPSMSPSGLYWRTGAEWTWLMGSDEASAVHGTGSDCCVVYDAPAAYLTGAQPSSGGTGSEAGRALMLAHKIDAGIVFKELDAAPGEYDALTWDEQGTLMASNARQTQRTPDSPLGRVSVLYPGMSLSYQPHDSSRSRPLEMPGPMWAILAMVPGGDSIVVGDYTRASGDDPQTSLYLWSMTGERVPLGVVRHAVVQAVFPSPDGRYLLVDEYSPLADGQEEHRLVSWAIGEATWPVVAAMAGAPKPTYLDTNWFYVRFVTSGLYAGKALVRDKGEAGDSELRLIDPARPRQTLWAGRLGPQISTFTPVALDTGLLISLSGWQGEAQGTMYVDAEQRSAFFWLVTRPWQSLAGAWQRGDRLVYSLIDTSGYGGRTAYSVRSLDLSQLSGQPIRPVVLHEDVCRCDLLGSGSEPRYWAAGPGLLATIEGEGSVHARAYDGSIDLQLESDVTAFYTPHER